MKNENLFNKKNVESTFEGFKVVNGTTTNQKCIIVGVSEKKPKEALSSEDLVPKEIDGLPTDVLEVPQMFAFSGCSRGDNLISPNNSSQYGCLSHCYDADGNPYSCPSGGASIGPSNHFSAGTLGYFALNSENRVLGITNNHVLGPAAYDPSLETPIKYYVSALDSKKFIFSKDNRTFSEASPAFDGDVFPFLESGRKYIFQSNDLRDSYFLLTYSNNLSGKNSSSNIYTSVTIKDKENNILYKNGKEVNNSGRTEAYIKNNEILELIIPGEYGENFKKLFYGSWSHDGSNNELKIVFFGKPYCLTDNKDRDAENEYFDGVLNSEYTTIAKPQCNSPSNIDANPTYDYKQNEIGSLDNSQPIYFYHPANNAPKNHGEHPVNTIDAALIRFAKHHHPSFNMLGNNIAFPPVGEPKVGEHVFKSGRTTGSTPSNNISSSAQPKIMSTNWTGFVYYCSSLHRTNQGLVKSVGSRQHAALFSDCIYYYGEEEWFTDSGDSGSAVISKNSDGGVKMIGLHFAGFTQAYNEGSERIVRSHGLSCKMSNIFSNFKLNNWNGSHLVSSSELINNKINICGRWFYPKV